MATDYDDNVNDIAFESTARDKAGPALSQSTPDTVFQKAVVIDVINDPAAFRRQRDFDKKYPKDAVTNHSFIKRAPRNSVIARVINDGQGKRTEEVSICLPFFPPHLCFPIKPGEHVWLISPAPLGKAAQVFYWMCRVPTWEDVDDVNYTHEDRFHHYKGIDLDKKDSADIANNREPKSANAEDPEMYGFPNGTAESDGFTFGSSEEEYDIAVTGSLAFNSFKFEPVPRLTKMPGDMVLQGSNNTSITLGTTRGFKGGFHEEPADADRIKDLVDAKLEGSGSELIRSSATLINPQEPDTPPDKSTFSAAIDIVAGRSLRTRKAGAEHAIPSVDTDPPGKEMKGGHAMTFPRVKKTVHPSGSRGEGIMEVSKNPQGYLEDIENQTDNPIEGDPDFRYDASRIYVTSDSKPDIDFGLKEQMAQLPTGAVADDAPEHEGAAIVVKSDHVRIIARKDPDAAADPKVNGSIRIIKEGPPKEPGGEKAAPPGGERAVISIEPDGTIIIDGPRIVIGNNHASLGSESAAIAGDKTVNDHVYIGGVEDATFSVFLAEELGDTLIAFATDVVHALGDVGALNPNSFSMGSKGKGSTPGLIKASIGNSGAPITNPDAHKIVDTLRKNLNKSISKVIKIK